LDVDPAWRGYILAPLAVVPASQKQGIGKLLVGAVIEDVAQAGADSLFVYGDPDYYGRFGFNADAAAAYTPPYPLEFAHGWLARRIGTADTRATGRLTCVESLRNPVLW
jgi:putative acetyltransferase